MYLPQELIAEILSRLPVDSLLRFKTICTDWRSLIEDPAFIDSHMAKSEGHWVYMKNFTRGLEYKFKTSCYGLVLERYVSSDKYILKNPSTRKILDLPIPQDIPFQSKMGMCHVRSTGEIKLVIHCNYARDVRKVGCNVMTVGIDTAWRNTEIMFPTSFKPAKCQTQMVKENYFMLYSDGRMSRFEIICLEMGDERCCSINVPSNFFPNCEDVVPLAWEGRLALVGVIENELHVWVLEDHEKQRWAEKKIVIPLKSVEKYWSKMMSFKDFGQRRFDIMKDLSFCEFRGDSLLMKFEFGEMALVDVSSGRIKDQYYAPEGKDFGYYVIPSLLRLKGMQPQ